MRPAARIRWRPLVAGKPLVFNGAADGTLPGADFIQAIWSIYLGPDPASDRLKKGTLGNFAASTLWVALCARPAP